MKALLNNRRSVAFGSAALIILFMFVLYRRRRTSWRGTSSSYPATGKNLVHGRCSAVPTVNFARERERVYRDLNSSAVLFNTTFWSFPREFSPSWTALTRYCENGALAIDNNLSERMVRPCAIGRKN